MKNQILDGIMGLCVADALGVPVEFNSRERLKSNPVTDMREYGTLFLNILKKREKLMSKIK